MQRIFRATRGGACLEGGCVVSAGLGPGLGGEVKVREREWQAHCVEAQLLLPEHHRLEVRNLRQRHFNVYILASYLHCSSSFLELQDTEFPCVHKDSV